MITKKREAHITGKREIVSLCRDAASLGGKRKRRKRTWEESREARGDYHVRDDSFIRPPLESRSVRKEEKILPANARTEGVQTHARNRTVEPASAS